VASRFVDLVIFWIFWFSFLQHRGQVNNKLYSSAVIIFPCFFWLLTGRRQGRVSISVARGTWYSGRTLTCFPVLLGAVLAAPASWTGIPGYPLSRRLRLHWWLPCLLPLLRWMLAVLPSGLAAVRCKYWLTSCSISLSIISAAAQLVILFAWELIRLITPYRVGFPSHVINFKYIYIFFSLLDFTWSNLWP
jgi:hypothetical protein